MARESEKLGLPIPELLDTVDRDYFELLVTMIDNKVLGHDDKMELLQYVSDVVVRIDESIRAHANDYNIFTSDTFDGSRAILSEYLANVKKAIGAMRIDILAGQKAGNVTTNKYYGSATARNVESSLDGIEKAMNKKDAELLQKINALEMAVDSTGGVIDSLSSTTIKHGNTTVNDQLTKDDQRIKDLEDKVGTGLEAVNVKTARRYYGAAPNVEASLGAIDKQVTTNKADLTDLEDKVSKLQSGSEVPLTSNVIRHASANIKANNVRDALEELFTYADDVHSKWASSVGSPLTKSMTAFQKESATEKLVDGVKKKFGDHGIRVNKLEDVPKVNLWEASFDTNTENIYYPFRGGIYSKAYLEFGKKSNFPKVVTNEVPALPSADYTVSRLFFRNDKNNGYFWLGDSVYGGADYIRNQLDDASNPNTLLVNIDRGRGEESGGRLSLRKYTKDIVKGVFFMEKTLSDRAEYLLYNYSNDELEDLIKNNQTHKLFQIWTTNLVSNLEGYKGKPNTVVSKLERPVLILASSSQSFSYLGMTCNTDRCDLSKDGFLRNENVNKILKRDFEMMDEVGIDRSNGVYVYVYSVRDHSAIYKQGRIDRYLMHTTNEVAEHKVIRTQG